MSKHGDATLFLPTFDEPQRLAALRRLEIMDTPAEPEFDELVETAAAICETPIGLITLLDESRQWFKAAYGLSLRETAREISFCTHTIRQNDVMQVDDATGDQRFYDNPLVTGDLSIRFYAGVPINGPEGQPLGSLCVIDHVARSLNATQLETLRILGQKVTTRLALRQQRLALQRALAETEAANLRLAASEQEIRQVHRQLEAANAQLLAMATTDSLTGLLNRRAFLERLSTEFALARRNGSPLSLLMLDVDNFKLCNDTHGHDAGDRTLTQFARVLQNSVRETDLVVRYGGEEFVVLLPDTGEASAKLLGERILAALRSTRWPLEPVTASGGCATMTEVTSNGLHLVSQADEALYAAKRAGKDRIVLHGDSVLDHLAMMGN
jgi:diguanylate cyclase (GGDEF)-like protein